MRLSLPIVSVLAVALLAAPALAQTSNYRAVDAVSGQVKRLAVVTALKKDCSAGAIGGVRVVTPPKNGNLQLKRGKLKTPASFRCPGVDTTGEAVFYTSKPGFSGQDEIVYDTKSADGTVERFSVKVTVTAKPAGTSPGGTAPAKKDDKEETLEL